MSSCQGGAVVNCGRVVGLWVHSFGSTWVAGWRLIVLSVFFSFSVRAVSRENVRFFGDVFLKEIHLTNCIHLHIGKINGDSWLWCLSLAGFGSLNSIALSFSGEST